MKKRYISIILLIIMALSFTGSAFAEDVIIDLSEIKKFEELKEALKSYSTSFKTIEDARAFWSSYWTHAFPPKEIYHVYDLNLDAVLLRNVLYYGYGSLVPRGEQKHDRYGEALKVTGEPSPCYQLLWVSGEKSFDTCFIIKYQYLLKILVNSKLIIA